MSPTSNVIYLVRHAKAGDRTGWTGDDLHRPLSKAGWRQSRSLAERLGPLGVTALYSSPYVRCAQTLAPLSDTLGVDVELDERLAEGRPFEPVLDLLADVEFGAVLCSHGDIIPDVVQALHRRGMQLDTPPDWRKATTWVLKRKGDRITKAKVWPPPS